MEADNVTLPHVIHAEMNALKKLDFWVRGRNLVAFVTHAPCVNCARALMKRGVSCVYYLDNYGSAEGLMLLRDAGIPVKRLIVT